MVAGQLIPLLATAAAVSAGWLLLWRRRQHQKTSWTPVGRLSEIHIYPLKSGAGGSHKTARVTSLGLREPAGALDRCLVVVCEGEALCARYRRRLVLIHAEVTQSKVTLSAEGYPKVTAPLPKPEDDVTPVEVVLNETATAGIELGGEVSSWLRKFFNDGKSYTMIYFLPELITPRRTSELPRLYTYLADPKDIISYNFVGPVSILSTSSLKALNSRLDQPVTVDNFRQNLIIEGVPAFDDDSWRLVRVGGAVLRYIKPIHRCAITLVNPITGEVSKTMEPLKTLRKFRAARTAEEQRLYRESPLFGSCYGVEVEGEIAVGDIIYVMRR